MPQKLAAQTRMSRGMHFFDKVRRWFDAARGFDEKTPAYLRWYWWAYTHSWSPRFWDVRICGRYPLINAVLFGNYDELAEKTLDLYTSAPKRGKTLHISSLYGDMVVRLAKASRDYTLIDILPIQLDRAAQKIAAASASAILHRMNAEKIECENDTYDQSIIFFLLHEVSPAARANILAEAIRITKPGGGLYITEYNEGFSHFMHKLPLFTWFSGVIEPCLPGFWKEKLADKIDAAARATGKTVALTRAREVWRGFYRIHEYTVGRGYHHSD